VAFYCTTVFGNISSSILIYAIKTPVEFLDNVWLLTESLWLATKYFILQQVDERHFVLKSKLKKNKNMKIKTRR